ncbi:MAG: hypothetical protein QG591_1485 [Planctomycetota bacterium]|nr:hypothetical protein [Planctomycetota bacterium]
MSGYDFKRKPEGHAEILGVSEYLPRRILSKQLFWQIDT